RGDRRPDSPWSRGGPRGHRGHCRLARSYAVYDRPDRRRRRRTNSRLTRTESHLISTSEPMPTSPASRVDSSTSAAIQTQLLGICRQVAPGAVACRLSGLDAVEVGVRALLVGELALVVCKSFGSFSTLALAEISHLGGMLLLQNGCRLVQIRGARVR